MACYDIVKIQCPECCKFIEAQTKSGECNQKVYYEDGVSARLLAELDEEIFKCSNCGITFQYLVTAYGQYRILNN